MGKLIPVLLALLGLGGGVGAGIALRPAPELPDVAAAETPCGPSVEPGRADEPHVVEADNQGTKAPPRAEGMFYEMSNQFVVPLIHEGKVEALVVLSLTLEVAPEAEARIKEREPRLRDRFLRVMLDHANTGGFDGAFTSNGAIDRLKTALHAMARAEVGASLYDVLLLDIGKQST